MKPTTVTMGCVTCGEKPGAAEGYVCKCCRDMLDALPQDHPEHPEYRAAKP
jgi:hypothetical protein